MPRNELGKKIVVPLPLGLYFVGIWAECNLKNIEYVISEDGFSVVQRVKKPNPKSASDLLSFYTWHNDQLNVVVRSVEDALIKLKDKTSAEDKWTESEIVTLEEEVIRVFVDSRGNPLEEDEVGHRVDEDGRQFITFFLKTVEAHRTTPKKATFGRGSPNGMNVGGDDESEAMFEEQTVEEVRAEMDELRNDIAKQHKQQMEMQRAQMEQQKQQMELQQQQIQQQMQQQMQFVQQMMQQMMMQGGQPAQH